MKKENNRVDKSQLKADMAEIRKRGDVKSRLKDLLYILPPSLALSALVLLSLYSMILSLFLIYFILPMFYTVERRIRARVTGIGKRDFRYADGYKAFFKGRQGGIFGVIFSLFVAFMIGMLVYLIAGNFSHSIVNIFPESKAVYSKILDIYDDNSYSAGDLLNYVSENIASLERPLSLFTSVVLFLPAFYIFFYAIEDNLSQHFLATIVLPDIDKNISASQARSIAKGSFGKNLQGRRIAYHFKANWPYMLAFALIYTLSTYLCTLITTANNSLVPLLMILTPTLSAFYGPLLAMFTLENDYIFIEASSRTLESEFSEPLKMSIYQTYNNPNYIHGEESAFRGCFVPDPKRYQDYNNSNPFADYTNYDNFQTKKEENENQDESTSFTIDLSEEADEEKKE